MNALALWIPGTALLIAGLALLALGLVDPGVGLALAVIGGVIESAGVLLWLKQRKAASKA